jgi:RNA polymerase sigma factor (sigma-70 family)
MMKVLPVHIVAQCKKGKASAQRELFDHYYRQMYNICFRYVKDEMETEDVLSAGFTKVFKHIGKFTYAHENGLKAWIKKIMVNECLMVLRKKNNFFLVPLSAADEIAAVDIELHEIDTGYMLNAIGELPTGYRTVLNLYVVEGYSHAEIGAMLNIKEATSRSQLNKAKQALKEKIIHYKSVNYGKR